MATIILILSAILFIATFGIHVMITNQDESEQPLYIHNPLFNAIPWVSGFILAVIPQAVIFEINWIAMFFINLALVWLLGPMLTKAFLIRLSSGKGLGNDMFVAFTAGLVALFIGLLIGD